MEGQNDSQLTTMRLINPPTLFGWCKIYRNVELLKTLTYEKGPQETDPGGHNFWIKELPEYLYQQEADFRAAHFDKETFRLKSLKIMLPMVFEYAGG